MINKRTAIDLHNTLYPVDKSKSKDDLRRQLMGEVSTVVKYFRSTWPAQVYDSLGDVRQAVLVVMVMRDGLEAADSLFQDTNGFNGKIITSSNWGKRKANKAAAKKLSCQWESNKRCFGQDGCGCNG